jgi:coproporphyrinogen III oxidase-like Fe-S oxidoreductase
LNTGPVLIESLITYAARNINKRCLRFTGACATSPPQASSGRPALLYIHVPFCEQLCPYCSFNRVEFREDLAAAYFAALRKEIMMYRGLGYAFKAVYAGGGTPTVMLGELEETLGLIRDHFEISEVSVETNPNHLTEDRLRRLRAMGVNRLSVGVQTFDDGLLKALNRYHKYGGGREISDRLLLTQGMFDTLNVDMICDFPGQTSAMLEGDLANLRRLGVDQITYYPLMASSATRGAMRGEFGAETGGNCREFYSIICRALSPLYRASTVWCFSRGGAMIDEYPVTYEDYAGLGSGSIGMFGGRQGGSAYANTFDISEYIEKVEAGIMPVAAKRDYSMRDTIRYDLLMKLFGLELDLAALNSKYGTDISRYIWPELTFFRLAGAVRKDGDILRLTPKGRYYWFIMMREFFTAVNNFRDYCRAGING